MEPSLQDLQQIFEYELKRKLSQRAKISSDEMKILLNVFRFFDLNYTGIINKDQWIQGILRTGLTGFSLNDLDSLFSLYDKNNSGQIDYKNFCGFLYGREQLNPLSNNEQSLIIQQDYSINNNINNSNQNQKNQENESESMNNSNLNLHHNFSQNNSINLEINDQNLNYNDINNNSQRRQNISLNNNINNQRNYINYNKNNNYENNQRTPLNNNNNNEYQNNSNFRQNQRKINSYYNTFNNIFQQEFSPENSNTANINSNTNNLNKYKNRSQNAINSIISTIKNSINTNNGITLYTFIKNLKNRQSNNSISIKELNNIFREMRINFALSDLQTLFDVLNNNRNNNYISLDKLINLIKGNLDERRKLYIIGIFSNLDIEKTGEVSISLLKNMYNCKHHPDVLNGTKTQEEVYEQFCNSLDLYCEINDIQKNGNLSFENFVDYYSGISSCIPDEVYFEDMLKEVWNNSNSNTYYNENYCIKNNVNNMKDEYNTIGINSVLMGITQNDSNRNNRFNNSLINNQYNNVDNRMKNSLSFTYIDENNTLNKGKAQANNINNPSFNNTNNKNNITKDSKIGTPFSNSRKSPEGIKVYQNKRRYNPITDEYYEVETPSNNNKMNIKNFAKSNIPTCHNSFININKRNNNNINKNNNSLGVVERLRNILISRGSKSIFSFQRMLTIHDRNHTGQISLDDFITIFQTYNLNFTYSEIRNIFQIYDINQTGNINYDTLLSNLIGQMNERRLLKLQKVFETFNKNENGEVLMSEIKQKYNSSRNPDVVNEKKTKEEVYGEFLDKLEIFREYNDNLKGNFSTTMNYNEFINFYNEISMNIKDDNLFDYLLNNCWDLDRFTENNQNNSNNNQSINNNKNYEKNIIARTGEQIMGMNIGGF